MSNNQDQNSRSTRGFVSSKLYICLFSAQSQLTQSVAQLLNSDLYQLKCFSQTDKITDFVVRNKEQIDCIVFVDDTQIYTVCEQLWQSKILLPTVILNIESSINDNAVAEVASVSSLRDLTETDTLYHQAEIRIYPTQLKEIKSYINLAINKFLNLAANLERDFQQSKKEINDGEEVSTSLLVQQRRLTNKIKERLGYLGVYYKRNPSDFYCNVTEEEQIELRQILSRIYKKILLNYFEQDSHINQLIDEFVDRAFFADISTSQILEIHMDLIDEFSHQLHIEGRNDDILLDYRLPLIDITAHLCEMYRRSIPREDVSLELLFRVE